MESTKSDSKVVHAVFPVSVARAMKYPQPWLMLMRDKLSYGDEIAVVAYDDRETLGIEPLQEGFVIDGACGPFNATISAFTLCAQLGAFKESFPVSKWWPGMTIHDDPETIIVGV